MYGKRDHHDNTIFCGLGPTQVKSTVGCTGSELCVRWGWLAVSKNTAGCTGCKLRIRWEKPAVGKTTADRTHGKVCVRRLGRCSPLGKHTFRAPWENPLREGDRGTRVCNIDSGCGVTLVEAWMVCCACVHARMMRVGMMCRGFCFLAVFSQASAFNGDLSAWDVSAVTNMQTSAPHAISAQAHMSSSHWLLGDGLQSVGRQCAEGDRGVCVIVIVVVV
jgi:surface protein